MTDEQRAELRARLRGGAAEPEIPFAKPDSLTRVYAVTSGKGGVGKSSVTANLAAAMAAQGLSVGVVDADIYGFSIPRMLGVERVPTQLDGMIVPPVAHGVKVISIGMFVEDKQPVIWRGPMLHRAVQQFLSDVFWGDLDVLLLDLPPGTGDVTISYQGDGQSIASFALSCVGILYVWGGMNFSSGVDCSGFVYAVYRACGYGVSRFPDANGYVVPNDAKQPGDILRYPGHYAIYVGGGMEVEALNAGTGVVTMPVGVVNGGAYYTVRVVG